eukprot:746356-Hanusia_phi.AAC.2
MEVGEIVSTLPCKHMFHHSCISKYAPHALDSDVADIVASTQMAVRKTKRQACRMLSELARTSSAESFCGDFAGMRESACPDDLFLLAESICPDKE